MIKLAILASGTGSNAKVIIEHFEASEKVCIALVASNNADAGVLSIAEDFSIKTFILNKQNFKESEDFIMLLKHLEIDFVVLAGFLWKVPSNLILKFPDRIVNVHPALLPKYGGKGMYGHFVHEAVHANKEKESGITIHFVNENYDEGNIIFQAHVQLAEGDIPLSIEQKVRALELKHYAAIIDELIRKA